MIISIIMIIEGKISAHVVLKKCMTLSSGKIGGLHSGRVGVRITILWD